MSYSSILKGVKKRRENTKKQIEIERERAQEKKDKKELTKLREGNRYGN